MIGIREPVLRLTPWARRALSAEQVAEIKAGPPLIVSLIGGRTPSDWTCRLWNDHHKHPISVVYHYQGSAIGAYHAAISQLQPDEMVYACQCSVCPCREPATRPSTEPNGPAICDACQEAHP